MSDRFEDAKLFIVPIEAQIQIAREPQLTAYAPDRRVSYTVFFQANPDKTTTVICGEAYLGLRAKPDPNKDFAPLVPGASDVLRASSDELQTITFSVQATREQVESFYSESLSKAGFEKTAQGEFARVDATGNQRILVKTRSDEKRGGLTVNLMKKYGGGAAHP